MNGTGWLLIFVLDAICDLLSIHFNWREIRYFTKPLITILLAIYSVRSLRGTPAIRLFLLTSLGFSGTGDVFLLFDESRSIFFPLGLASFLFAHLFYLLLFLQVGRMRLTSQKYFGWPVLAICIYTTGLFLFIRPGLGVLSIPVFIYSCTISAMLVSCIAVFGFSKRAGKTCIAGAVLFVLSDSLLAINKFHHPFPEAGLLIMLIYIMAQLFIVTGICRSMADSQIIRQFKKGWSGANQNF